MVKTKVIHCNRRLELIKQNTDFVYNCQVAFVNPLSVWNIKQKWMVTQFMRPILVVGKSVKDRVLRLTIKTILSENFVFENECIQDSGLHFDPGVQQIFYLASH